VTAQLPAAELLGKSIGLFKDVTVQKEPRSVDEIQRNGKSGYWQLPEVKFRFTLQSSPSTADYFSVVNCSNRDLM